MSNAHCGSPPHTQKKSTKNEYTVKFVSRDSSEATILQKTWLLHSVKIHSRCLGRVTIGYIAGQNETLKHTF